MDGTKAALLVLACVCVLLAGLRCIEFVSGAPNDNALATALTTSLAAFVAVAAIHHVVQS